MLEQEIKAGKSYLSQSSTFFILTLHLLYFLAKIRLSAFIAEHNLPFNCMEHIPKLVAKICPDARIAKGLACSRTKTGMIVKNVLGAQSFQLLCEDLKKKKFPQ